MKRKTGISDNSMKDPWQRLKNSSFAKVEWGPFLLFLGKVDSGWILNIVTPSPVPHSRFYDFEICDSIVELWIVKTGHFFVSMITINGNVIGKKLKNSIIQTCIYKIIFCHFHIFTFHSSFTIKISLIVTLKKNF